MAKITIDALPPAVGLDGTEFVPIAKNTGAGYVTEKTTVGAMANGGANASYIVADNAFVLPEARVLAPEVGKTTITDNGPGSTFVVGLADSGVAAGEYGDGGNIPQITVDETGRLTTASQTPITGFVPDSREVIAGNGLQGGGALSTDVTLSLANSGVTPGTYGDSGHVPEITVDDTGRVTTASQVPIAGFVPDTRQIIAGTGLTGGGPLSSDVTIGLDSTSVASLALADSALQKGANLSDVENVSTSRSNLAIGPHVANRTVLAALLPSENPEVFLLESGRQGTFLWNGADLSASVAADAFQGVFVPPTGQSGSTGAWVRDINSFVLSTWFGIGTASDTAMFNSAIVVASLLSVPLVMVAVTTLDSEPTISVPVTIQGLPGSSIDGTGIACINIGAATIPAIQISGVEFQNFTRAALWVQQGATIKYLNVSNNVFTNCRLALSNQGDTSNPSYDIQWYYVPQPNSFINRMIFSNNIVDGTSTIGKGGIALTCGVTDYNVEKNTFRNMVNSDTSGTDNALNVPGVWIFLDGYTEGSPNYELIRRGVVSGNHFFNGVQNVASKGSNAIILSGSLIVASDNTIENWYNSNSSNPGQPGNNDEAIYGKALQFVIVGNSILNSGGSQGAINIKGTEVGEGTTSPYGMYRIISANSIRWTSTGPITHYKTGVEVECAPAIISSNIFEGLSSAGSGVVIRGTASTATIPQSRVTISGNRFSGSHTAAVSIFGASYGVDIDANVNIVNGAGATGANIAFVQFSETRTNQIWGSFLIQNNYHEVTNLTVGTYNCAIRIAGATAPAANIGSIFVEGNQFNHLISGQPCQGIFGQNGGQTFYVNNVTLKNNKWPSNLGSNFISTQSGITYSFDINETLNFSTINNTAINALIIPITGTGVGSIELSATAIDTVAGNTAYYQRSTLVKNVGGAGAARVGAQQTPVTIEDVSSWDCNVGVQSSLYMNVNVTGDATNPVTWALNIRAITREA